MLIKQISRAVVAAWSPNGNQLVGGSAAQQLDASFNTSAALEIFDLGLADANNELQSISSITSEHRFHKIVWGSYNKLTENGIIVGGCDDGILQIYDASKLNKDASASSLLAKTDKHSGAVRALDFNPFQTNLLATGASQSEIFIWDLNNTGTPMTPGTKSQPFENVQCISWNRQVQHILASTFSSRCVVWDLRKNEPIIKLSDSNGRVSWRIISWHPDVATQLCLASEDDLAPVIQLWDLRFATAPLKVLENHQRGVLSMAWCQQDPDLLISCGKDNRILCWNPNSNVPGGEVLSELARTSQWSFEVSWCPKNPALISSSTSDGILSVYSLMGGPSQAQLQITQQQTTQMLADSFPGMMMGDYNQTTTTSLLQQQQQNDIGVQHDLAKPPKWLKKPVGAKFAFGGKLLSFSNTKSQQNEQQNKKIIFITQVITEPELVERSNQLENTIEGGNFIEYCRLKADSAENQHQRYIWYFIKTYFEPNPRDELLNMLGYKQDDVYTKLSQHLTKSKIHSTDVNHLTNQMASLNRGVSSESEDPVLSSDTSADLSPGLDGSGVFDAIAANADIDEIQQQPFDINTSDDSEGLITQALLTGNTELAVELCFENDRMADGLALAITGGPQLIERAQKYYLKKTARTQLAPIVKALVHDDWSNVINNCKPNCWREALAGVLTHTSHHQLPYLIEKLGERLEQIGGDEDDAMLCYICAGSIEHLVKTWWKKCDETASDINQLQDLIEVVIILKKALELQGRQIEISGKLAQLLRQYSLTLSLQGSLVQALSYLGPQNQNAIDSELNELRERLYYAIGHKDLYAATMSSVSNTGFGSGGGHPATNQMNLINQRKSNYPSTPAMPPPAFNTNPYATQQPAPSTVQQQQQPTWMQQNKPAAPFMPQQNVTATPSPIVNAAVPPPPRPSSTNSTHSSSVVRNKYVLDPSVQPAAPVYPVSNMMPSSAPYSNPLVPPMIPVSSSATPNYFNPPVNTPLLPPQPVYPTQNSSATTNMYVPTSNNYNYPTPTPPPPTSSAIASTCAPGWNDPPVLHKTNKSAKVDNVLPPPNPITQPLFAGAEQQQNNGYHNQTDYYNPNINQNQQQLPPPPPLHHPTNVGGGFMPNVPPAFMQQQQQQQQQQPMHNQHHIEETKEIKEPVKLPIPEEHIHLKTVFDELQMQCFQAANNPQTKRKLDDVKRKLECLYDLLRENRLSSNTLNQLHQIIQLVQNGDYNSCLNVHTQLVSGPDFAQIASFMPGLKVLLQSAHQLQVFIR